MAGAWKMSGSTGSLFIRLPRLRVPLRRAAGERVGPIAKQWEGEVVLPRDGMFPLVDAAAHLTLPAQARVPSLSPAMTRAERASDTMCEGDTV